MLMELGDLDPLACLKNLTTLSLLHNPVTARQHYRLYLIYKLPQLRLLDFRKIKQKERDEAKALFKSKKGKELQKEISRKAKTFVPGAGIESAKPQGKCFFRLCSKKSTSVSFNQPFTQSIDV
jgi:U2 small nuclear ribonucleoprotein A'